MKPINCPRCGKQPQSNEWKFEGQESIVLYFCANENCSEYLNRLLTIEQWDQVIYPTEVAAVLQRACDLIAAHGQGTLEVDCYRELQKSVHEYKESLNAT